MNTIIAPLLIAVVFLLLGSGPVVAAETKPADDCTGPLSVYVRCKPFVLTPTSGGATIDVTFGTRKVSDKATVNYTVSIAPQKSALGTSAVFTSSGEVTAVSGKFPPATLSWPATASNGKRLRDGGYRVEVRARLSDPAGKVKSGDGMADSTVVVANGGVISKLKTGGGAIFAAGSAKAPNKSQFAGFPYNFYYGSTHGHTRYSDGGVPCDVCQGSEYGHPGGAEPKDAFKYARKEGLLDFFAIIEHNHLLSKSCSDCSSDAAVKAVYKRGFDQSLNATEPGKFVAVYGMEWGVIKKGGHVNVYNQPKLISWPKTPRDVEVPQSDYKKLYTAVKKNQPAEGSYMCFNHPKLADFNGFAISDDGKKFVTGLAVISGPAFTNVEDFSGKPDKDHVGVFKKALTIGWKVAPEAHQDNHCWNYGTSTSTRTVALIPSDTQLDLQSLMSAFGARRIYASEDANAQLKFATTDGEHIMGESFSSPRDVNLVVAVADPDGEDTERIEIWGGPVTGNQSGKVKKLAVIEGESELKTAIESGEDGEEWFYFAVAQQGDGDRIWSAPMWVTWDE